MRQVVYLQIVMLSWCESSGEALHFSEMSQTTENENWTTVIKPRNGLFEVNLKEIWDYMGNTFQGGEKYLKKLRKTDKLEVYEEMVNELFTLLS